MASRQGHCDITKLLLKAGAIVESKNFEGKTAIDMAKDKNHSDIIALLDEFKQLQMKEPSHPDPDVNHQDGGGWTKLHWSSYHGKYAECEVWINPTIRGF